MADLRHGLKISASTEEVDLPVASAQGFRQWWAELTEPTGTIELGFFNRTTGYRLRSKSGHAPVEAEFWRETGAEGSGTRLIFHRETAGSGTLVGFTHAGWQADTEDFVSCNTVWGELMFRLKAAAEGKRPGPQFLPDRLAG